MDPLPANMIDALDYTDGCALVQAIHERKAEGWVN